MPQTTTAATNGTGSESVGSFTRLFAHELGNPVATIRMSAEMLAGNPPAEMHQQLVDILLSESGRLESLIESAVYYTSMPASDPVEVEVEQLIRTAANGLTDASEVEVDIDVAADHEHLVFDPAQLVRALREIMQNAVDAGASHISVNLQDDNGIVLTIRDDGEGVPEEKNSAIFDPFFTTREGQLGLGLSIVHRIVQHHKGSIAVRPTPASGTEVRIHLPSISR